MTYCEAFFRTQNFPDFTAKIWISRSFCRSPHHCFWNSWKSLPLLKVSIFSHYDETDLSWWLFFKFFQNLKFSRLWTKDLNFLLISLWLTLNFLKSSTPASGIFIFLYLGPWDPLFRIRNFLTLHQRKSLFHRVMSIGFHL